MNSYQQNYTAKLMSIGKSFTKAIKAHCYQCASYSMNEDKKCTNKNCALFVLKMNRAKKA